MYTCVRTYPKGKVTLADRARIVVIPDVHADLAKAKQCFILAGLMNAREEWTADPPDTVVVQLGDQVDGKSRGIVHGGGGDADVTPPCGAALDTDLRVLRFFNDMHTKARDKGGSVFSLMGNHEIMNVQGIYSYVDDAGCGRCARMRAAVFAPGRPVARLVACTRAAVLFIEGFVFVHAGIVMDHLQKLDDDVYALNDIVFRYMMGLPIDQREASLVFGPDSPFNTRAYSPAGGPEIREARTVCERLGAQAMFVGHNAHPGGLSQIAGGRVFVFDPGMSHAILDSPATVVDLKREARGAAWVMRRRGI